jgi:hypothetical protein
MEIGHIGFKKFKNFVLISKKQTRLSDKMLPKKLKLKKLFSNFVKSYFLNNFFGGHIVTKVNLQFLNQYKIFDF